MLQWTLERGLMGHPPLSAARASRLILRGRPGVYLLDLCDKGVDEVLDLRRLGGEQDQLLVGQVELQHVF